MAAVRACTVCAAVTFLRLALFYTWGKSRELFFHLCRAAAQTFIRTRASDGFEELAYLSALCTFVLINRHLQLLKSLQGQAVAALKMNSPKYVLN
jgi:hypothetical protein